MVRMPALAAAMAALAPVGTAIAESVSNPVTGYQVSIFRSEGGSNDFQG